jgi:hypothetical protein
MVDINACPFAELLLTEIYDVKTSTLRDDYPIILRNYITQQLEDTTWLDAQAMSTLSNAIFGTFMRNENGDVLTLRKPALQRKIGQILRSRTNTFNPIAIPLLVRFMIPGLPPLSMDPLVPILSLDHAFSCSRTDRGATTAIMSRLPSHMDDAISEIGRETLVTIPDSLLTPDATHHRDVAPDSHTRMTVKGDKNVQKNGTLAQSDKDDYADKLIDVAPASAFCSTTIGPDDTHGESAIRNRHELQYDVVITPHDGAMPIVLLTPADCIGAPTLCDSGDTVLDGCAITTEHPVITVEEKYSKCDIGCNPSGVSINHKLVPLKLRDVVGANPNVVLTLLPMGSNLVLICDCITIITTTSYWFPFRDSNGAGKHPSVPP